MLQRKRTVIDYVETEPGVFEPAPPLESTRCHHCLGHGVGFDFDWNREPAPRCKWCNGTGRKPVEFYQPGPMLHGDWSQEPTATGTTINRTAFFLEDLDGITGGE